MVIDKDRLREMLDKFTVEMRGIFKENLVQVLLFGSYASGRQDDGSDVDIMVLVDLDKVTIKEYREKVIETICDLGMEYDILISPIIQNRNEFEKFKDASGFFKNVDKQGVKLSA